MLWCFHFVFNIFVVLVILTGGMEELTLEQIKTKSELEEDIDFENGDFFYCKSLSCKIMARLLLFFMDKFVLFFPCRFTQSPTWT